jgi:CRP-like cAMP-binding protein
VAPFQEKLLSIARPVSYSQGERLLRQGEASRGAFLIRTGEVEARVALPGGGMLAVARLGEGEMFGETALLERGVCSASVFARTTVEGWFVDRADFRAMAAGRDAAALQVQRSITRALVGRLRALNARVLEHPGQAEKAAPTLPAGPAKATAPSFDWRAFLPALPFFEGFDLREIDELASAGRAYELARGAVLFEAGEPAEACFIVVRGALEVAARAGNLRRRIAVCGPGELVGYLSVLEGAHHGASAQVRESACLLELSAAAFRGLHEGASGTCVRLQQAIHRSLLRSLARTNTQLTRLITAARLRGARSEGQALEAAYSSQIVAAEPVNPGGAG